VDPYASQYGFFTFAECPDVISPTIGMYLNTIYTFDQSHRSNYYHPMGFAYNLDGALTGSPELEPVNVPPGSSSSCDSSETCPSPIYFKNGVALKPAEYSNLDVVEGNWVGSQDFGLDDYEPEFFIPLADWAGDIYSVKLKFTDSDIDQDIFYFCHIHAGMSGRIKIFPEGGDFPLVTLDTPEFPTGYEYAAPSAFDLACGTVGLEGFQTADDNNECPTSFVCADSGASDALTSFTDCINAMDCKMLQGMTTSVVGSQNLGALFSYQMIPHHINAVNMAKALLHTGDVVCEDLLEENDDCTFEILLRSIIVVQNLQIQAMEGVLAEGGYDATSDCVLNLPIKAD